MDLISGIGTLIGAGAGGDVIKANTIRLLGIVGPCTALEQFLQQILLAGSPPLVRIGLMIVLVHLGTVALLTV
jgi:hypothetical protein